MNNVFEIELYRGYKAWVFDDEARQLKGEPFVLGASEVITKHMEELGINTDRPVIQFSITPIPNPHIILTATRKHYPQKIIGWTNRMIKGKNKRVANYFEDKTLEPISADYIDQDGDKLWLCPAQVKFFGHVADTIYARFV